jgi:DNA adenine methylase
MTAKGHKVYVSEYSAPSDFKCVWEKETKSSLSANGIIGGSKLSVERLFYYCA